MTVERLEPLAEAAPEAAAEAPAAARAWLWLGLLVAVTLSSSLCVYCVDGLVDPIKRSLHISDLQMSFVLGWAYVAPFALCVLPAGWLSDRAPRRLMLMCGAALWASGAAGCALANSLAALCLARAVVGVGAAVLAPASISILAGAFPARLRARVFGVIMAASGVGPGIGLTASGVMLSLAERLEGPGGAPWRLAILFCAAPAVLALAGLALMGEAARAPQPAGGAVGAGGGRGFWGPLLMTLLAIAAVTLSDGAQLSWSAVALVREHALPPAAAARLAGYVFIFCGAGAPLAAGTLADIAHRRYGVLGRIGVAIAAVAALAPLQCFFSVTGTGPLLAVMMSAGFAVVTGEVVGAAILQDIVPDHRRGLAAAANGLCGSSAIAVGTTAVALLSRLRQGTPHAVTEAMSLATVPASAAALAAFVGLWLVVRHAARTARAAAPDRASEPACAM